MTSNTHNAKGTAMKTLKLFCDDDGFRYSWLAKRDSRNGGWLVTDHHGDKKFFTGSFAEMIDYMNRITLPNWGMRLIGIGGAPYNPGW